MLTRYPALGALRAGAELKEIDDASVVAAEEKAEEGAALAPAHGLGASSRAVAREESTAATLLAEADRTHADAIVIGSRGLGGLGSLLLGSVSHALLQDADRPVVIVPSPKGQAALRPSPCARRGGGCEPGHPGGPDAGGP